VKIESDKIKSILLVSLSNLGDIILTTPVLERLREEFPGAVFDVMTGPAGEEVFSSHPAVREVIVKKKRASLGERLGEVRYLRGKRYDLAVDLKRTLLPYLAGAKYAVGAFSRRRKGESLHKKDEHLALLFAIGIEPQGEGRFFLPASEDDRSFARKIIPEGPGGVKVLINPGAKSHLKRWDALKFASLSDRLVSEMGAEPFISGNADDTEVVRKFLDHAKEPVTDLVNKTTVGALAEVMRRISLVITNDSAPLHVASAVGVPAIAIFGPSNEMKYGPLSKESIVLKPDVPCRPCERALCAAGPDEGCISRVSVEEVLGAARSILKK